MFKELTDHWLFRFIMMAFIAFVICSLPMIIYRFLIRKYAVERSTAKNACYVYGFCIYILTALIGLLFELAPSTSLLLMQFVFLATNFRILTHEGEYD